jgi:membrane protein
MTKLERLLLDSKPVAFIREKSKHIILPGFEGLPLYDVSLFFFKQVKRVGLNERAAAISFNFIMAIPAASIFLFTLLPYLPVSKLISTELFRFVRDITPDKQTRKLIIDFLDDFFNKPKTGLLSIGFVLAVYYSSNAMMGVIRTFDRSLQNTHKNSFFGKRLRAIRLTTIVIVLILGTSLISLGQGTLFRFVMNAAGINNLSARFWIRSLRWIVIIALFLYSIGIIYKYAPSVKKRWKLLSPGAFFATFLTISVTAVFSIWVQNFSNYNKVYGSIGTLLIIMLLISINSLILLIGFELNVSITELKIEAEERQKKMTDDRMIDDRRKSGE